LLKVGRSTAIASIVIVIILIASATIILTNSKPAETPFSASVTDALGRNVTISGVPEKIVSCAPSITETVYSVGLGAKLVGVTDYCDWPADVTARKNNNTLASIGGWTTPNTEAVINLSADVVFIDSTVPAQTDMLDQLEEMKVTVVALYPGDSFDEVYKNIGLVGTVCDMKPQATALTSNMKFHISWVESQLALVEGNKSIADVVWLDPVYVAGNNTYVQEMIDAAVGINAFGFVTGWPSVNMEAVLQAQPDVVIMGSEMMMASADELITHLQNDEMWSTVPAVQNNSVYVLTGQASNLLDRAGPRLADAVELIADMLYPEAMGMTLPHVLGSDYDQYLNKTVPVTDDNVPKTVTDGLGRTVKLSSQPAKIVSTSDTTTEMLYALGLGDNIIGVSSDGNYYIPSSMIGISYTGNYPQAVREGIDLGTITETGPTWVQNAETLAGLHPDLVVLDYASYSYSGIGDQLTALGITYIVTGEEISVDQIYHNIQMLGDALGKSASASRVVGEMSVSVRASNELINDAGPAPRAAFMFLGDMDSIYAVANSTFMDSLIQMSGATNAFGNQTGWVEVNMEAILQANPDVIIVDEDMGGPNAPDYNATWAMMQSDPLWSQLDAVQNHRVYFLTGPGRAVCEDASIHIVEGLKLFEMMNYPGSFDETLPLIIGWDYQDYLS
jgi:iron complex transport system substrate-binding protein